MNFFAQHIDYTKRKIKIPCTKQELIHYLEELNYICQAMGNDIPEQLVKKEIKLFIEKQVNKITNPNTKKIPSFTLSYYQAISIEYIAKNHAILGTDYVFFDSFYYQISPQIPINIY